MIESATFRRWIRDLKDLAAAARISANLRNASLGNLGDTRAVGDGLFEMRVHHGPGYPLHCLRKGMRWWCCAAVTKQAATRRRASGA